MGHLVIHMAEHVYKGYNESVIHISPEFSLNCEGLIKHVVICGMGGSAISADIAQTLYSSLVPITVVRDFNLPFIDKNTLCVFISYSGNTEETVECMSKAMEVTPFITGVTSGGRLKELLDPKYLWIEIPAGIPPRSAIGYLFFSLLRVLEIMGLVSNQSDLVERVISSIMQKASSLCFKSPTERNLAKSSAETIYGKTPVIYSSTPLLSSVAYRWKCQINENAKLPAFHHSLPELLHNEIEGWESVSTAKTAYIPILLRLFNDDAKYTKSIDKFQELLTKQGIDFIEFYGDGDNVLCDMFVLIYLGDMISFYLGILNNVDPTSIDFIDFIKKK